MRYRRRRQSGCLPALGCLGATSLAGWVLIGLTLAVEDQNPTILIISLLIVAAVVAVFVRRRNRRAAGRRALLASGISTIRDPHELEVRVAWALQALGWKIVQAGGGRGDGGADVVARSPDGRTVAVQCKLYYRPCGYDAVLQAHGARDIFRPQLAAVAAPGGVNDYGCQRAHELSVQIWDRSVLADLFNKASAVSSPRLAR